MNRTVRWGPVTIGVAVFVCVVGLIAQPAVVPGGVMMLVSAIFLWRYEQRLK